MSPAEGGLREASREAVRSLIAHEAEELFVAKGFEATTVEEIAAAVGMSQRSFFRYFSSKEDVVLEHLERLGDDLVVRLEQRPLDEPEWDSLRRSFDLLVEQYADAERRHRDAAIQRTVERSPGLLAGYLQKFDRIQLRLTDTLVARERARTGPAPDPVVLRAMVGAAFACLQAATSRAAGIDETGELGGYLDDVMSTLRPAGGRRD